MLSYKTALFFRSCLLAMLVLTCAAACVWFICVADTATRTIGFADSTPALFAVNEGDAVTVGFFGHEISVPSRDIVRAADAFVCWLRSFMPEPLRALFEYFSG